MKLRPRDIVFARADEKDPVGHPGVLISPAEILESPKRDRVNVLLGTKKPPAEKALGHHVLLNGGDGLEFVTLLDCSFVYVARKAAILRQAGTVSRFRRDEVRRKLRTILGLG